MKELRDIVIMFATLAILQFCFIITLQKKYSDLQKYQIYIHIEILQDTIGLRPHILFTVADDLSWI